MRISDWSSDVCSSDLPPSPAQLRTIEAELRSKIGARYSALEAVRAVLPGQRRASRKQFCSRLIAQAFAAAGIQLVARPNRSEERRGGKGCVSTCRSRWSADP